MLYAAAFQSARSPRPRGRLACTDGLLCRLRACRLGASDVPTATVAPHQEGHDECPHGQQKQAYQLDDRWDEALIGHHPHTVVHERSPGNRCHQSHPARVDPAKGDGCSEEEECQTRKEEREAVHRYLSPPNRLGCRESGTLLRCRGACPGVHSPLEGHTVYGLENSVGGRCRHRSSEAEGRYSRANTPLGTNGVVEGDKATEQE